MSTKFKLELINDYFVCGLETTLAKYDIQKETLLRYLRVHKKEVGAEEFKKKEMLFKLAQKFSNNELRNILNDSSIIPNEKIEKQQINFEGKKIKFGFCTDLHTGSIYFLENLWESMCRKMQAEKCEFVCIAGDITEGMNTREGHIYELNKIGYDAQKEYAIDILKQLELPIYMIDGNHDRWVKKSVGACIVKDIANEIKDCEFIGHDEGDLLLNGNVTVRLWHGEDGSSYATSYRLQKIVESFTGGEKPNVLLAGHTHKTIHMPNERNIEVFSGGTMSKQSKWMRSKKLAAHIGFWIITLIVSDRGIAECQSQWFPYYEKRKTPKPVGE